MDKIKEFFKNKKVILVEWIILIVATVGLILGGTKGEDFNQATALVIGVVDAIGLLAMFISSKLK